jgi:hypothetical protein
MPDRGVVILTGIGVITKDVDFFISGVPVTFWRRPYPNQVVQAMVICQPVVYDVIQSQANSGTPSSPPEPGSGAIDISVATGFMQGPPQYRHVGSLEFF